MIDTIAVLLTWTTYGTWLPGDVKGWRKRIGGPQLPQPLLADWCRRRMKGEAVLLETHHRDAVENACHEHCVHRGWHLYAVSARTNHVHVVVAANAKPQIVRDQLKANCTRDLRQLSAPLHLARTWTKGGDCERLETDEDIHEAVIYVTEAQDQKGRDQPHPRLAPSAQGQHQDTTTANQSE